MAFALPRPAWKNPKESSHGMQGQCYKCQSPPGLNPVSIVKGNKKGFYRYINSKMKTKEIVGQLQNADGGLVTKEMEKAKYFFILGLYG